MIKKNCPICNKTLKAISEKQWEFNYKNLHVPLSVRHKTYLELQKESN
jgi:glutaredoxin